MIATPAAKRSIAPGSASPPQVSRTPVFQLPKTPAPTRPACDPDWGPGPGGWGAGKLESWNSENLPGPQSIACKMLATSGTSNIYALSLW